MEMKIHLDDRIKMCTGCGFSPRPASLPRCPVCGEVRTLDISRQNAAAVGKGLVVACVRSETTERAAA